MQKKIKNIKNNDSLDIKQIGKLTKQMNAANERLLQGLGTVDSPKSLETLLSKKEFRDLLNDYWGAYVILRLSQTGNFTAAVSGKTEAEFSPFLAKAGKNAKSAIHKYISTGKNPADVVKVLTGSVKELMNITESVLRTDKNNQLLLRLSEILPPAAPSSSGQPGSLPSGEDMAGSAGAAPVVVGPAPSESNMLQKVKYAADPLLAATEALKLKPGIQMPTTSSTVKLVNDALAALEAFLSSVCLASNNSTSEVLQSVAGSALGQCISLLDDELKNLRNYASLISVPELACFYFRALLASLKSQLAGVDLNGANNDTVQKMIKDGAKLLNGQLKKLGANFLPSGGWVSSRVALEERRFWLIYMTKKCSLGLFLKDLKKFIKSRLGVSGLKYIRICFEKNHKPHGAGKSSDNQSPKIKQKTPVAISLNKTESSPSLLSLLDFGDGGPFGPLAHRNAAKKLCRGTDRCFRTSAEKGAAKKSAAKKSADSRSASK